MPVLKLSYVAHVPGHKNSKGDLAPWVIKDHNTGKILSSHSTEGGAKSHLQDMHAHSGALLMKKRTATVTAQDLDRFTASYIETALWSTNDGSNEQGGEPFDSNYGFEDIAPSTVEAMFADCQKFQHENEKLLDQAYAAGKDEVSAGHDFWLTRNGHGAGFWDGDYPANIGDLLTKASKKFGEADLYLGDNNFIYQSGAEGSGPAPVKEKNQLNDDDRAELKRMGIIGSSPLVNGTVRPQTGDIVDKEATTKNGEHYDYEANGDDVVLIAPKANGQVTTHILTGEDAKAFWMGLDSIESRFTDLMDEKKAIEYRNEVDQLIAGYLRGMENRVIAVQADDKQGYVSGVTYAANGLDVEKFTFTSSKTSAKLFARMSATDVRKQIAAAFKLKARVEKA